MKKKSKVLIIILAVIIGLVLFKNVVIKVVAENAIKAATGFSLDMGTFKLGIINSYVSIKDLKLYNPKDFEEPVMVDIPEIHVDYSIMPLLTGKVHIADLRFHMKEVIIVTNKDGDTNINRLKALQPEKREEEKKTEKSAKKKKKPKITIDHLALKVDQVVIKDFSKGDKPSEKTISIALDYEAEDITNVNTLVMLIVSKTMMSAGLSNLLSFDPSGVLSGVTGTVGDAAGMVGDTAGKVVGETTEAVKKTTNKLKGLIKSPFGKK